MESRKDYKIIFFSAPGVALSHTPERQATFDGLKRMLTNTPRDDPDCLYLLDTDASGTAGSAVLL